MFSSFLLVTMILLMTIWIRKILSLLIQIGILLNLVLGILLCLLVLQCMHKRFLMKFDLIDGLLVMKSVLYAVLGICGFVCMIFSYLKMIFQILVCMGPWTMFLILLFQFWFRDC